MARLEVAEDANMATHAERDGRPEMSKHDLQIQCHFRKKDNGKFGNVPDKDCSPSSAILADMIFF